MYATWHHKLQVLPQDDEAVAYHFDRCEAVIVLYGDAGCHLSVDAQAALVYGYLRP